MKICAVVSKPHKKYVFRGYCESGRFVFWVSLDSSSWILVLSCRFSSVSFSIALAESVRFFISLKVRPLVFFWASYSFWSSLSYSAMISLSSRIFWLHSLSYFFSLRFSSPTSLARLWEVRFDSSQPEMRIETVKTAQNSADGTMVFILMVLSLSLSRIIISDA